MKINVDRDFMCPYIRIVKPIPNESAEVIRYEVGDEIFLYKGIGKSTILSITSKVIIVYDYDNAIPVVIKIEDLEGYLS